jgi:glycosyltransferase involved in cell wall biosynthesis
MKVLMSAYACDPARGSEPAVGWNWCVAAARRHDVVVLTRGRNAAAIEANGVPERVRFEYVDLPDWLSLRGAVVRHDRLNYTLWQLAVRRRARQLDARERFDLVHHVTYANAWLPALAHVPHAAFVLGPVGGGMSVNRRFLPSLTMRGALVEIRRTILRRLAHMSPLVRDCWRRADMIVVQNEEASRLLPAGTRAKTVVRPNAVAPESLRPLGPKSETSVCRTAVAGGRMLPWKGLHLALRAIALVDGWGLAVVGDGPERNRLEALSRRLEISDRVAFHGRLSQSDLWSLMSECDALLLPSVRDDAPLITVEAQRLGLPVIALDQGGPAQLAKVSGSSFVLVRGGSPDEAVSGFAAALGRVARGDIECPTAEFGITDLASDLDGIYEQALRRHSRASETR